MHDKIGFWSLVVTKSRNQGNYLSQLLVTSVKTPLEHHLPINLEHHQWYIINYLTHGETDIL
jgi:hypothetical protein